jgi:hypothetical protein
LIRVLGFALESAALAGIVATVATVIVGVGYWLGRPALSRLTPARRADTLFVIALLPGLATLAVVAAAALPSLWQALVVGQDHCLDHGHHAHLCIIHFDGLRPTLAVLGAATIAVGSLRASSLVSTRLRSARAASALERLGSRGAPSPTKLGRVTFSFPVVHVPGPPRLCHAVGLLKRRVLISASLARSLSPQQLQAALLHEHHHLARLDGITRLILELADLFAAPGVLRPLCADVADAAEQACDAAAAVALRDGVVVAESLVEVANISVRHAHDSVALAFWGRRHASASLEQRVNALIGGPVQSPSRGPVLPVAAACVAIAAAGALWSHASIHHGVETLLALIH